MKRGKYRPAIFALVYVKRDGKGKYLLLKRKLHWNGWEFPKGGIEFFEIKRIAVRREVKEETGLDAVKIKKFNVKGKYTYHKKLADRPNFIGQSYSLFAIEVKEGKVKIDKKEHSTYKWVNYNEAAKKLTWENQKKCLKIVNDWLKNGI